MSSSRRTASAKTNDGGRYWSSHVTKNSDALTLEPGVFKKASPRAIALSLMRSADQSRRKKSSSYRSAMSMLTFFLNRAGSSLTAERRQVLNQAKDELRKLKEREA
jgi:hypothetical protein